MQRRETWRRLTGGLALFALLLQLAVSFAHVHREDFAGRPGQGGIYAAADETSGGQTDPEHLTCDICATVHLAGTLVVPAGPALTMPVPPTAPPTLAQPANQAALLASAFFARGPPQA